MFVDAGDPAGMSGFDQEYLQGIHSRIGAARIFLSGLKGRADAHAAASKTQARALLECAKDPRFSQLTADDVSKLVAKIVTLPWAACEGDSVAAAFAKEPPKPARRKGQNFMSLPAYFTRMHHESFLDMSVDMNTKTSP